MSFVILQSAYVLIFWIVSKSFIPASSIRIQSICIEALVALPKIHTDLVSALTSDYHEIVKSRFRSTILASLMVLIEIALTKFTFDANLAVHLINTSKLYLCRNLNLELSLCLHRISQHCKRIRIRFKRCSREMIILYARGLFAEFECSLF